MRVRIRTQAMAWILLMCIVMTVAVVFMSPQGQRNKWHELMRDIPHSADDMIRNMQGRVPDDVLASLQSWATKVEDQAPKRNPWEAEQTKRKEFIRKVCYEVREAEEVHKPPPEDMLKYMVMDNVDNVIFCPNLEDDKARDWQRVLAEYAERALRLEMYARGSDSWEDASEAFEREDMIDDELLEEGRQREGRRSRFHEVMNAQSVQEVLGSYYIKANIKVLLVEHPFERLLSFYLETIRDKVGITGEKLSKKIINIAHRHETLTSKEKQKLQVSFPQFMNYLLFRVAYDPHLKALYHICHPCDIQYDYIIKMETFHEDIANINQRIRATHDNEFSSDPDALPLPERRDFPYFNLTDEKWIQEMLYSKYSKIKSDKLLQAFDLFSIDIFLFNYSWPFEHLSLTKDKRWHR